MLYVLRARRRERADLPFSDLLPVADRGLPASIIRGAPELLSRNIMHRL